MKLDSRHFGTIEINEEDIISFPDGVPGFVDVKKFVLLGKTDEDSPFQWLHGVDNPGVAFVVIDPRIFKPDYLVDVDYEDIAVLDIKDENKVLIYSIVVVPEDMSRITANLRAPVLINVENNMGKQIVLEKSDYQIKHYIMDELQKIGGEG